MTTLQSAAVRSAAHDHLLGRIHVFETREEWLEARAIDYRIGSSDVAKILGVSPHGTAWDVWNRKKLGLEKGYSDQQLADFERGHRWEARVLEDYQAECGLKMWHTNDVIVTHPDEPWAAASPDGFVLGDMRDLGGLEAKTGRNKRLWGESGQVIEEWGDGSEVIVRPDYALQCYYLMEVCGLAFWDLAVAIPRGYDFPELRHYRLMRDKRIQSLIMTKVGAWRERYLVGDEEPDPDGSEAARQALLARFPGRGDKVVRMAVGDEAETLAELAAVKDELKALERRKRLLTQKVCGAIGDDYGITLGESKALWTPTKGRAGFDTKALKAAHPDIAEQFATVGKPYRSLRLYGFDS